MSRSTTPTFITEVPLKVSVSEERVLLARLEAGRQLYNAVLGEAVRRVNLIKQSKAYQQACKLPKLIKGEPNPERSDAFRKAWIAYDFSDYSLQSVAINIRKSWIEQHIDADTAQKLGTRAFQSARNILLNRSKRVRFKGKNQMDSLEGKSKRSAMKWKKGYFSWKGLDLDPYLTRNDPVILHGLNSPVKYVRLVRRKLSGKNRFYVQLVNEGKPFQKKKNEVGDSLVGADIGPSTIAVVGGDKAFLQPFCNEIADKSNEIAKLQRRMSRQMRANNPDCFEPSRCDLPKSGQKNGKRKLGKSIKGKKQKNRSQRYLKIQRRKANIERKLTAHRKSLQGELVNTVLSVGKYINIEKLSYKAFQKMFGRSVGKRAPGTFVSRLKQKAENASGYVNEFPTRNTKLSQRCVCGAIKKKPLKERIHSCPCGVNQQRDLFSAYLALHVDGNDCFQVEQALSQFSGVESLLRSAWKRAVRNFERSSASYVPRRPSREYAGPLRYRNYALETSKCKTHCSEDTYNQSSIGSLRVVNVEAASASEKIDQEPESETNKNPDVVGQAIQLCLFDLNESWGELG